LLNAPGSGFAGSAALQAFLPLICRKWFGEELLLPFVESWWLGQKAIREKLLKDLTGYILLPAFGKDSLLPVKWANLSAASRKQWLAEISRRPWDFVVQKEVIPSTVPTIQGRFVQDKSVVLRAFTLNGHGGPVVLPGGLARIGKPGVSPQLWPEHEGFTKDVWLTGNSSNPEAAEVSQIMARDRLAGTAEVPSRIAEQLYWVGRYAERLESLTRMLRVALRCIEGESGRRQYDQLDACLRLMDGAGAPGKNLLQFRSVAELSTLIFSKDVPGSLTLMANALIGNAAGARDRISDDTWICFNQLKGILDGASREARATDLLRTLDRMVLQLSAFSGLQAENMIRGHGWRFLETGRRIERAQTCLGLLQASKDEPAMLEPLIEICDSVMTYRRRYFSRPDWKGVVELLFFDRGNPRAVGFQIAVLCRELDNFPGDPELGLFPKIKSQMSELDARISDLTSPDAKKMDQLGEQFGSLSDLITQHYFSHSVRRVY
jgi:uncharacterized alpha-E superfamily protein